MKKRRPRYTSGNSSTITTTSVKPLPLSSQSTTISNKKAPNTEPKTTATPFQIEVDLDALTYYPPMYKTAPGEKKTGGRTGFGVQSKIGKRRATTTKLKRLQKWNKYVSDDDDDKRDHDVHTQRKSINEFDNGHHNDRCSSETQENTGCDGRVVMDITPGVYDTEDKTSRRTGNAMAMTSANAYGRWTSSYGMEMPVKKRFVMKQKKDCV